MQGKASLILTDKDSGRVVKRLEEHNIVTDVLEKIINIPAISNINFNSTLVLSQFMPVYNKLAGGVVLFGSNIEEDRKNYIIKPEYIPVGGAGRAYTGTNSGRGTFNASQSGEIDNGYRFVWDFAPEKAVGTIKCIGLTNFLFGDIGFRTDRGSDMALSCSVNVMEASSVDSIPTTIIVPYSYYGRFDRNLLYSFRLSTGKVTLHKNSIGDPSAVMINDTITSLTRAKSISETSVELPFSVSSIQHFFYDPDEDKLWFLHVEPDPTREHQIIQFACIDPASEKMTEEHTFTMVYNNGMGTYCGAVCKGKFYIATDNTSNNKIYTFTASGGLISEQECERISNFYICDGYLMASVTYNGYHYKKYIGYDDYPLLYSDSFRHTEHYGIEFPYRVKYYTSSQETTLALMFMTNYLVTINNLSEPIEKTDMHALQIRYEITN